MHFSVFIPIHHSFGFFDIFLEGGSRDPKDPPGKQLLAIRGFVNSDGVIEVSNKVFLYGMRRIGGGLLRTLTCSLYDVAVPVYPMD